ncbi:MAG: nitrite reductase small subunit NirD [Thermoleophilaceae bacterium]|nr:nitrite reductase small subunit NirD [Thermoleophilaceae bacterium]
MIDVCGIEDVPLGEGRAVTVDGSRIAVFHSASGWYALDDVCPHRGGPLSDGLLADSCVTCPLHDRRFALDSGESMNGEDGVTAHTVRMRGERVFVELAGAQRLRRAA